MLPLNVIKVKLKDAIKVNQLSPKPTFDPNNFTRIVWRTEGDKKKWEKRLNRISRLHYKTELETVKRGIREACTLHVSLDNLPEILKELSDAGLHLTLITKTKTYQGFSHRHHTPMPGEPYVWYSCVTRTKEEGERFKEASFAKNQEDVHIPIGELLGYPECCTNKFIEIWKTGNYDGMFEIALESNPEVYVELRDEYGMWYYSKAKEEKEDVFGEEDVPILAIKAMYAKVNMEHPEINPLLRYFGIRVISHFPCSLNCRESVKVAREWIDVMYEIDEEATDWLLKILSKVERWDSFHGVVEVYTPHFLGETHTYPYLDFRRVIVLNNRKL